ncbi:MAG: fructosamine kinase family protein [Planctomycetota bacterium]
MSMTRDQRETIEAALGVTITHVTSVIGGDINRAFCIALADGTEAFVKTPGGPSPSDLYEAEAAGLRALRRAAGEALVVPAVLAVGTDFLVLEALRFASPPRDFEEQLGRGLALLHRRATADRFGFACTTYLGRIPQDNAAIDTNAWPAFWRERRLLPILADFGRDPDLQSLGRQLADRLDTLLHGPAEPPTLIHGDLWSGNAAFLADLGRPAIFDPAGCYAHREVEFGMTRLFGFGPRFEAAYHETHPLADGWERRVEVYRLHHLLSHAWHFGGGYVTQAESLLRRLLKT